MMYKSNYTEHEAKEHIGMYANKCNVLKIIERVIVIAAFCPVIRSNDFYRADKTAT